MTTAQDWGPSTDADSAGGPPPSRRQRVRAWMRGGSFGPTGLTRRGCLLVLASALVVAVPVVAVSAPVVAAGAGVAAVSVVVVVVVVAESVVVVAGAVVVVVAVSVSTASSLPMKLDSSHQASARASRIPMISGSGEAFFSTGST